MTQLAHSSVLEPDQRLPANALANALGCQHALLQIEELAGFGQISNERLVAWFRSYIQEARALTPYPPELQRIDDAVTAHEVDPDQKRLSFSDGHGSDDPLVTGHEREI